MICEIGEKSDLKSQHLKIHGQTKLKGTVRISGAKNSALVLLAASLLSDEKITIENIPDLTDVEKMKNILKTLGVKLVNEENKLIIDSTDLHNSELPYELVNGLRASFFCMGSLLARLGEASLSLPGGCKIGKRPIDEHIKGLKALGATISSKDGFILAKIRSPLISGSPNVPVTVFSISAIPKY